MGDWVITPVSGRRSFPVARHRHPNGEMPAVRDTTPTVVQRLGESALERWTFACACGEVWVYERVREGSAPLPGG